MALPKYYQHQLTEWEMTDDQQALFEDKWIPSKRFVECDDTLFGEPAKGNVYLFGMEDMSHIWEDGKSDPWEWPFIMFGTVRGEEGWLLVIERDEWFVPKDDADGLRRLEKELFLFLLLEGCFDNELTYGSEFAAQQIEVGAA